LFLCAASANWNDTSTGIDLNKLRHFPLTKIHTGRLKDGARISFDGITATGETPTRREARLRGTGKSGKKWDVRLSGLDEIWRGDLDGNGTQDYVLFSTGPYGNGRAAPEFSLSILLMDSDKLPVPFFTVVWKGENGDGMKHLVDLNHDGQAELLISTYDESPSDPRVEAFCSGHWTTQLYTFRDLSVEEVQGTYGRISFPFVHNWSQAAACGFLEKPRPLPPMPLPVDHGTSFHGEAVSRIRRSADNGGLVAIDPVAGCIDVIPEVVVYDIPQVREIAFPNPFTEYVTGLTETIRRIGSRVEFRGLQKETQGRFCRTNLLWATSRQ
jgi:hypothetical protein